MRKNLIKIESLNKFTLAVSHNIFWVQQNRGSQVNYSRKS